MVDWNAPSVQCRDLLVSKQLPLPIREAPRPDPLISLSLDTLPCTRCRRTTFQRATISTLASTGTPMAEAHPTGGRANCRFGTRLRQRWECCYRSSRNSATATELAVSSLLRQAFELGKREDPIVLRAYAVVAT